MTADETGGLYWYVSVNVKEGFNGPTIALSLHNLHSPSFELSQQDRDELRVISDDAKRRMAQIIERAHAEGRIVQ